MNSQKIYNLFYLHAISWLSFFSLSLTWFPIHSNMQCLAAPRGFSNANFTRRHHHLICIISRLCILFSLFYKYTHSTHCPMGLTAISDHHLFLTRGAGLFLEVNQGKNGKIFFSLFILYYSQIFQIFPDFSQFFLTFPNFS